MCNYNIYIFLNAFICNLDTSTEQLIPHDKKRIISKGHYDDENGINLRLVFAQQVSLAYRSPSKR